MTREILEERFEKAGLVGDWASPHYHDEVYIEWLEDQIIELHKSTNGIRPIKPTPTEPKYIREGDEKAWETK